MTDDTQDKVRRNVVTLSALVIGAAFLDLNITNDFKPFGLGIAAVSAPRLWIAITVVLIYLFLRYHFDDATNKQREKSMVEYRGFKAKWITSWVQRDLNRFLSGRREARLFSEPAVAGEIYSAILEIARSELGPDEITLHVSEEVGGSLVHWAGRASVGVRFVYKGHIESSEKGFQRSHGYAIPRPDRCLIRIIAVLRAVTYSKSSVDFFVPYLLSLLALGICVYRTFVASPYGLKWLA